MEDDYGARFLQLVKKLCNRLTAPTEKKKKKKKNEIKITAVGTRAHILVSKTILTVINVLAGTWL